MGKLDDKIIAVTGANRGIGLAISRQLNAEGASLTLIGRDRRALEKVAGELGDRAQAIAGDLTRPRDVERIFRTLRRRSKRLDVLINNAGVFTYKPFVRTSLKDWRANIESNLTSLFLVSRAALPLLRRSASGHLINILSISSRVAFAKCSAYSASKFGALGLTGVLREELRSYGIRVTAILPGSTDTRLAEEFDFPVNRKRLIHPDDVAAAVLAALLQPPRTTVEEILLMPSSGRL